MILLGHFFVHGWISTLDENTDLLVTPFLYKAIVERPLHIHYHEIMTSFIVPVMQYCRAHFYDPQYPTSHLLCLCGFAVENLLRIRKLSAEEVDAIRDFCEFWLPCVISASQLNN